MRAHAAARSPFALIFTWAGALIFLVSLLYFLFSYSITFGVPAPDGGTGSAITWNVTLFTLFALHHSVCARDRVRRWIARVLPEPLERSFYVWIASLMFIAVCALWRPVAGIAWSVEGGLSWALLVLQIAGVWVTLHSAVILGVWDLSGVRATDGAIEFKTWGPYGWVRHPIYTGWFLIVFAASFMTMTRVVFAIVSCVYLLVAIPFEERSMRSSGSEAYERYVKQVPWRLLPGVY